MSKVRWRTPAHSRKAPPSTTSPLCIRFQQMEGQGFSTLQGVQTEESLLDFPWASLSTVRSLITDTTEHPGYISSQIKHWNPRTSALERAFLTMCSPDVRYIRNWSAHVCTALLWIQKSVPFLFSFFTLLHLRIRQHGLRCLHLTVHHVLSVSLCLPPKAHVPNQIRPSPAISRINCLQ